jgi:hypothetical protein
MVQKRRDELVTSRTEKGKKIVGCHKRKANLAESSKKSTSQGPKETVSNLLPFIILGTALSPNGTRRACKS